MAKEIILTQEELEENCLLESGIINAMLWHDGQLRKGTNLPYIVHPLEVMNILLQMGADKKLMIAGVLHDTAEDTEATLADIEEIFGKDVADLVASHTEMDKSLPWRERKEIALEHLAKASKREQMLVLADKLSNIEAMDGYVLTDSLSPRDFSELIGLDYEVAQALYTAYAVSESQ